MGEPTEPEPGAPVGRRIVLGLLGLGCRRGGRGRIVLPAALGVAGADRAPRPDRAAATLPLGPVFRFYSVTGGVEPRTEKNYRLEVGGLVAQPATYRLDDLRALPQTSFTSDFHCVTGWVVPGVPWVGVPLSELLDRAQPSSTATAVRFRSFDGVYTESLSLADARDSHTIVALQMLDGPVSHNHGGPVRMYVDGQYGYKSTKWLSGIELTEDEVPGYWEHRGYDIDGTIRE